VTCGRSAVLCGYSTPVSSTNKTVIHDITEILLKVALKEKGRDSHKLICKSNKYMYTTQWQNEKGQTTIYKTYT
jgi:hypothetical protein